MEQLIISVGREFGSGGHIIASKLSDEFAIPLYDYNLLRDISTERALDVKKLEKYDEIPKNKFLSRRVRGYSNSPEENIAYMQFEYLQKEAKNGKSFVIVGRCAETVLQNFGGLVSVFILADMECKIERTMNSKKISRKEAEDLINYYNKRRKEYHNYYCTKKWGDSRNYDISINSSKLGLEKTTDILIDYIKEIIKQKNLEINRETKNI